MFSETCAYESRPCDSFVKNRAMKTCGGVEEETTIIDLSNKWRWMDILTHRPP
jgi:hypothetical protein